MEHFSAQITLQVALDRETYDIYNLDTVLRAMEKTAQGMADACEGNIVETKFIHYPSGSGEPVIYDSNGKVIE